MKVYWDTEDYSFIIENDNGKRMRITSSMVEENPTLDHIAMTDAMLIYEVDPLDTLRIGDQVIPSAVVRDGVVLRLIGTAGLIICCGGQWRTTDGKLLRFAVNEAVLHSKNDDDLLRIVRNRMIMF